MYRLLWQVFHEPSHLYFCNSAIKSQRGIQEGDTFGPILFSVELDDMTRSVDAEFTICLFVDYKIGDSPKKVIENVPPALQKLILAGLELNSNKYELFILGCETTTEVTRTADLFQGTIPDMHR